MRIIRKVLGYLILACLAVGLFLWMADAMGYSRTAEAVLFAVAVTTALLAAIKLIVD